MAVKPSDREEAMRLMAQPVASAAALSAYGAGLAIQGFGMWLRVMATSMEAVQQAMHAQVLAGGTAADDASMPARPVAKPAARRAKAAVKTLIEDAQAVAGDGATMVAEAPAAETEARPRARKRPARPDDLKAISGIGPKLEKVLNDLGIWTYAQVAALGEAEVAWLDNTLSLGGRIGRDGWIEQAGQLATRGK